MKHVCIRAAILEQGVSLPCLDDQVRSFLTYESNVLFALRFMVDTDIVGGNWVRQALLLVLSCRINGLSQQPIAIDLWSVAIIVANMMAD